MSIKRGIDGKMYAVFRSCVDAEKWDWLFVRILRRRPACFGEYDNAFELI